MSFATILMTKIVTNDIFNCFEQVTKWSFFTIVSKCTSNVLKKNLKYIQSVPKGNKF